MYRRFKKGFGNKKNNGERCVYYEPYKSVPDRKWQSIAKGESINIVCVDPGTIKYCLRIESRCPNPYSITTQFTKVFNAKADAKSASRTIEDSIELFLDEFKECFTTQIHIFLVDDTYKDNTEVTRLEAITLSRFRLYASESPLFPYVVKVSNQVKTTNLGAPRGADKGDWAPEYAKRLLEQRGDKDCIKIMEALPLRNGRIDVADTINVIEAFLIEMGCEELLTKFITSD